MKPAAHLLEVEDLGYTYPAMGMRALDGVGFALDHGEAVGLVGANGAGKSTLLLALAGLIHADGRVRHGGRTLHGRALRKLRGRIGLLFQDPDDQLFMPTVFEDVAFGPLNQGLDPEQVRGRVADSLDLVGMAEAAQRSPHQLSAGEKRWVAVATVLAMEPELLLFDEPSASLDPLGRSRLISLLGGLSVARLVASHDLDLIRRVCSRCLVLARGRLVADGLVEEILADEELLRRCALMPGPDCHAQERST